jgi:hypothetical protein
MFNDDTATIRAAAIISLSTLAQNIQEKRQKLGLIGVLKLKKSHLLSSLHKHLD